MLNHTEVSQAKKTKGIGVTYRASEGEMYGTCPDTCSLKPIVTGTNEIDRDYEYAVRRAVPRKGQAFLYTHFEESQWGEPNGPGKPFLIIPPILWSQRLIIRRWESRLLLLSRLITGKTGLAIR